MVKGCAQQRGRVELRFRDQGRGAPRACHLGTLWLLHGVQDFLCALSAAFVWVLCNMGEFVPANCGRQVAELFLEKEMAAVEGVRQNR